MEYNCLIVGEILFGPEISFERLHELEEELKAALEEHMRILGATHLDFDQTHDAIVFQSALPSCDGETVLEACEELVPLMDDGVKGRLVLIRHGLEEISVCHFSPHGCEETRISEQ